jgi:signal transduction histidine kinase
MLELLDADLAAAPPDIEDARLRSAAAHAQSRRLAALAGGLLDLTRLDAGGEMRSEPVELGELCRAVAAEFEPRGGVELGDAGEELCWAMADPGAVARVLRILVDNALRYAGPPVRVEAEQRGQTPRVVVSDSGPGVAVEERELVFERFRRGSASAPEGGFGLGLAIARELARRMQGELTLEDGNPGARFALELPAAAAELVAPDPELAAGS